MNNIRCYSSKQWVRRQQSDVYVRRAASEMYRSRSAYKLIQMDDKYKLLRQGMTAIDCGASPGGWSQVLAQRVLHSPEGGPRDGLKGGMRGGDDGMVVAVDILPMEPIPGVSFMKGDVTQEHTVSAIRDSLDGRLADILVSDMAPSFTGMSCDEAEFHAFIHFDWEGNHFTDHARSMVIEPWVEQNACCSHTSTSRICAIAHWD